ncbi:MAG: glycosyltransferase family 4 protein [Ignavibacteria bacterium]|nr:glycosyltransferase family 4 protein [Ignavibacteria bacterium]
MNKTFEVSFISSNIPRRCGIATFTNDLANSFRKIINGTKLLTNVAAINDNPGGYEYPDDVMYEINDKSANDFKEAAHYLNISDNDVVNLQHEFGLYGGDAGSYILYLLENLRKPVVTTLHTVLEHPTDEQLRVIREINNYSSHMVVQSKKAQSFLSDVYSIPNEKIKFIPHGAHDVPFADTTRYKEKYKLTDKKVLLTFGLLGPGKGIEDVINALSDVVKTNPDVVYIVLGSTHPHVKKQLGESYRKNLENLVITHGLENNVLFIDRFVNTEELLEFLMMSDIYISPYHNMAQIVSGTLTYALASGKAIISTPYWYAKELLKNGNGILYLPNNIELLSNSITDLLNDDKKLNNLRRNAYQSGRKMTWKAVAKNYYEIFQQSVAEFKLMPQVH